MVFDPRRTYLCYNNSDLIRDGYIQTIIEKEYLPVSSFNIRRLKNPPKGVSFIVGKDENGNIVSVKERKKQLPASKIKVEIDFSKVMKSAVKSPFQPGSLPLTGLGQMIGMPLVAPFGFGGITQGISNITFHLLDAETKINYPIIINKQILDNGIIEFDGYPLSVFGVVREHFIKEEEDPDNVGKSVGLNFSSDDLDKIGMYSDGTWKQSRRKRIDGGTDDDGLFGGTVDTEIKFEDVKYDDQEQLFIKIVKDNRKLKFKGDNHDATGGKAYPFLIRGTSGIDATDKQIRISTEGLFENEKIYITFSIATERHVRQNLSHLGKIGQGNTYGITGFIGAIGSEIDAWDYKIKKWKVPLLPFDVEMKNIDDIEDYYSSDDNYKLTLSAFLSIKNKELNNPDYDPSIDCDEIEGWRLSESITPHVNKFWAADYRGILLYNRGTIIIIQSRSEIRDKDWFENYLKSLDFIIPTGPLDIDGNRTYLSSDFENKIEDYVDLDREPGYLFDLTEITNSLLFDKEKIPYYRPFANALKNISNYNNNDNNSGVGIINLDLLPFACNSVECSSISDFSSCNYLNFNLISCDFSEFNLEQFDLSYIEFDNFNGQPSKSYGCEESFEIHSWHYWSYNYDAMNEGPGAWYDKGFIEDSVLEWRPSGDRIESYWKLETPYYCGNFTSKSRVYVEKMGGNSLDNYSWIYTDTESSIPSNISLDFNNYVEDSTLVFNDSNVNYGLCYHVLNDSNFNINLTSLKIDTSKSHISEEYNHDKNLIIGQNRILGDIPSYSHGVPIIDDVCLDIDASSEFWWTEEFLRTETTSIGEIITVSPFGLNFSDDPPEIKIPSDWYIRELTVKFSYINGSLLIQNIDKYVSFYFKEKDSSISNFKILDSNSNLDEIITVKIPFNYYYGSFQFLGKFWKQVNINYISARLTSPSRLLPVINDPNITRSLDLDNYKIKSGQNAVVYNIADKRMVFYANTATGNIDAAISYDLAGVWTIHKNLIRLIENETASLPFVIKDLNSNYIDLFYVLNDIFLMYKRIDTNLFIYEDIFIEPKVPTSYDVGDYDISLDNPDGGYWGKYSIEGKMLRRSPSYFIVGSSTDQYFQEQIKIKDNLNISNNTISDVNKRQYPRFDFLGNKNEMKDNFRGDTYTVYKDNSGILRLFIISNGKLSIKRSSNYFSWEYDMYEQIIHKNYIDDSLNKGLSEEIQNIQLVRNDYDNNLVSILYFYSGMLFMRHFDSSLLFPYYDSKGKKYDNQMKSQFSLTKESHNKPIFLVGKIPEDLKKIAVDEKDKEIFGPDSSLLIYFPYNKEMLEKFDERFEVDIGTQAYAYVMNNGIKRIFYRDSFGNINGIIMSSLIDPQLEVMNTFY